jgi:predicted DNA-binding transcriptional regulator AlpA
MDTFEFTLIVSGIDSETDGFEDAFFEAGCDDATISVQKGVIVLDFAREATTFSTALAAACEDAARAGAIVERVEPDHLVSLSDVAERSGLTRQAISLYANAERGRGFPKPIARVTSNLPLWDWVEVAEWLHATGKLGRDAVEAAHAIREANIHLGQTHGGRLAA